MEKQKVRETNSIYEANNYFISHTSYIIINEKNNVIGFRKARTFKNLNELIKSCDIGLSTVILKKNFKKI